jgi:mutator protein MutT
MKHLDVAVAIIFRDSKVLVARRRRGGVLGGYWEFPGGKLEAGETLQNCLRRELHEELGVVVQPVISFAPIQYQYPDRHITLHAFVCTHESGEPKPLASEEIRWVYPVELPTVEFPPANQRLIEQVVAALPTSTPVPRHSMPKPKKSTHREKSTHGAIVT